VYSLLGCDVKCIIAILQIKNHRNKMHPQRKNDDVDALSAKRVRYNLEATLPHFGFTLQENPTLQCSYKVANLIKKCKKPQTIVEELSKPCAEKMVELMIGSGMKKKIPASFDL